MLNQSTSNASKLAKFTLPTRGQLPLEDSYPHLHRAIVDLATANASEDFHRQTDLLTSCQNLYNLHSTLLKRGYVLSGQALYLQQVPRRSDSNEVKLHVRIVPIKIRMAQNDPRNRHEDANFSFATKQYTKDIAYIFGAENVFVLSVDEKSQSANWSYFCGKNNLL